MKGVSNSETGGPERALCATLNPGYKGDWHIYHPGYKGDWHIYHPGMRKVYITHPGMRKVYITHPGYERMAHITLGV